MTVYLHNPTSIAHLEDLRDRRFGALACAPRLADKARDDRAQGESLMEVVRAMDCGAFTTKDALDVFAHVHAPWFCFGRWIVDMVDEGVYLEAVVDKAA